MTSIDRKRVLILNLIWMACAMGCLVIYDIIGGLWLKGITSAWFVGLGAVNLAVCRKVRGKPGPFPILLMLGLICGMCADILLGISFIPGALVFSLGHLLYTAAYYSLEPFSIKDLKCFLPVALFSVLWVIFCPLIKIRDPIMNYIAVAYALIIALMTGKAVSNFLAKRDLFRGLLLLGSVLFTVSDLVLSIDLFGTGSRLTWIFCSYLYWPSQSILAHALFHYSYRES